MILKFILKKSKLIYIINEIIIGFKWSNLNIYLYMKTLNE